MFNKLGTRTLVIVAAVLGLIWFLADRFGTGSQQRTFRSEILRLDTAAVSRIRISSRVTAHKPVLLERTGAQEWLVKYEGTEHRGSHATIQRLLSELRSLDADRMIGKMDAVKDRYDLTDSLATTVTFTVNGMDRTLAFGKRVQANNGPFTYVNLSGENEVYAIAGNVGGELDNKADHWRPRELMTGDPATWQRIDRHNPHRVIRALEVCLISGRPYSTQRSGRSAARPWQVIKIAMDLPREELYTRIDARVDAMIAQGLVEEARGLLSARDANALRTVGYRELFAHFDGHLTLEEAIALIKQHTRNYAKRQLTWLRRDPDWHWCSPDQPVIPPTLPGR
jgi:hypothetical protein